MTVPPPPDLLGAAMADFAAGRPLPLWLRVAPEPRRAQGRRRQDGRRLAHGLAAYFAPVAAGERALLDLVDGPVLDVGCGPARHARLLQAAGLTAIGLDRSPLALGVARSLGLRHCLHGDAVAGHLPAVRSALLLDGNLGLAGTPAGALRLLGRLATACGPGGRLLVGGRAPRHGRLRPLIVRDEYRGQAGPWGRWLQASLPAVVDLAAAAGWRLDQAQVAGGRYWAVFRTASASRSTWSRSATVGSKISSSTPAVAKASAISLTASGVRDAPPATCSAQSPRNP
jgi:SAM-dependent methyltransferase